MKKNSGKRKDLSFVDEIVNFYPEFLKEIRACYPLAVLSSLCIAISTFAQNEFASAQSYAIGAGICFLFAFICSLICRLSPLRYFAIPSYVSVGLGIFFLLLVSVEFGRIVFLVETILSYLIPILTMFIIATIHFGWISSCRFERRYAKEIMKRYNIKDFPTSYSSALRMSFFLPALGFSTLFYAVAVLSAITGTFTVLEQIFIKLTLAYLLSTFFITSSVGFVVLWKVHTFKNSKRAQKWGKKRRANEEVAVC